MKEMCYPFPSPISLRVFFLIFRRENLNVKQALHFQETKERRKKPS